MCRPNTSLEARRGCDEHLQDLERGPRIVDCDEELVAGLPRQLLDGGWRRRQSSAPLPACRPCRRDTASRKPDSSGPFAPGHHVMELGSESSSLSLSLSLSLSRWAGRRTYMGTIESFQKFTQQWPPALLARKMLIQAADPLALHQLCAGMTMLAGSRKRLLLLLTTGSAPPGTKALGCVCLSL